MPDEPSKRSRLAEDFFIGEWLVQPSLDRISRNGAVVRLRPQLTDLLVLLARHAGATVPREVILEEVWASQFVGESGLSRCIAEIRQALDDDARQPTLIETIPKRGYRLVAPVVFVPQNGKGNGNGNGHGAAPAPPGLTGDEPAVAEAVLDQPADHDGTPKPEAAKAARFRVRVPWLLLGVGVVAALVVTLASAEWTNRPLLSERGTVLLADVRNDTGEPVFDGTLQLALAVSLEQAPFLRILPRAAVRDALVRSGRSPDDRVIGAVALDVCRREGAAAVLAGSIARLGSRYAVGLEAIACGTGESLGTALSEARDKEHVLAALETVAGRVRLKLGESRRSLRQNDVPLVRATTSSLDALKALSQGDYSRDHSRIPEALALYRQATEIDPQFAVAWARRGAAAWTVGLPEEAMPAFRRAYDLRHRASTQERLYIEAHYHELVAADPARAIETYRTWKRLYPGSVVPPTNLVFVLAGLMGQYEAALPEALEAVRLAPYSSLSTANLVLAYQGLNRIADAKTALAAAANRGVSDRLTHGQLLAVAMMEGDGAAVERELQWASSDPPGVLMALRARALAAIGRGGVRESRTLWAEAAAKSAEVGPARRAADVRLDQAEGEALLGDPRAARTAVDAALAADRSATTLASAAIVSGLAGDAARANALLDEVDRQGASDLPAPRVWLAVARAMVAARMNRPDEAIDLLRPAAAFERGADFHLVPLGVRAIVERAAGRPAAAAAAFDQLLQLRAVEPSSPWIPFARLGLARALADSGDTARSLAAYDAFLESWKDADRDAPLLAIARRERARIATH